MALTYISYLLAKTPQLVSDLAKELSIYKSIDEVNLRGLEKLPLLNAVIRESIRMYPPVPTPIPRICPPQGATIGGYFIPAGVRSTMLDY